MRCVERLQQDKTGQDRTGQEKTGQDSMDSSASKAAYVGRVLVGVVLTFLPLALSVAVYSDDRVGRGTLDKGALDEGAQDATGHALTPSGQCRGKSAGSRSKSAGSSSSRSSRSRRSSSRSSMAWLDDLNQSPLTPPPYVFGVVWTTLYLLMGAAVALFVDRAFGMTTTKRSGNSSSDNSRAGNSSSGNSSSGNSSSGNSSSGHSSATKWTFFALGLVLFASQLAANYAYLRVMFVDRDVQRGLQVLYALLALFAATCLAFAPVSPLGAALLCPCAAYLVYAAVLHSYLDANNDFGAKPLHQDALDSNALHTSANALDTSRMR